MDKSTVPCTFTVTDKTYVEQPWYNCWTCNPTDNVGVFFVCAHVCHKGHQLGNQHGEIGIEHFNRLGFYCDCGSGDMKDPCKCAPVQYLTKMINERATVNNLQVDYDIVQSMLQSTKAGVISPVNLKMALELAGELFKCTDLTLPFIKTKYTEKADPALQVACGIFGYKALIGPPVLNVRFGYEVTQATGADLINKFVETKTNGVIKKLLNSEPVGTSLVSVLYFKGSWQDKFGTHQTKNGFTFKGAKGEAKVDMMCKYGREKTNFIATNNFESIVLPYVGGRFVAVLTLPRDGNKSMHDLFRDRSCYEELSSHFNLSTMRPLKVQHYVPKFKKEFTYQNMQAILHNAGFNFHEFRRRSGIDGVIQKVVVEVDEVGTTAAAVTAMVKRSASFVDAEWIGDRPFTFAIMDLSDRSILFWGLIDFSC